MDFQGTLFAPDPALTAPDTGRLERRDLGSGAWIDVARTWLPQPDEVFAALAERVPWRAEKRQMYDRLVDVPRLVHTYMIGEELPHPMLTAAREALSAHYAEELGEPFRTAGCCYYRDGRDSVAWHGDTIGRGSTHDTMVAIVSVGDPRRLCLRPRGGGESIAVEMGHGDLVVMGGSCQRTWEHAVPKVAAAGPRISVQFRPLNVF
ncbi:alpha-ketoglutarate-dependent dioxygenase AlkB [Nocardioides sp. GY 10113]|uniref:alpha-ketoglutarate-dependent dioxygenase AlkB n=1 Tax=Nocardioides sp. GY 10113 TaxID=2569761 RepID=UPI0010A92545|nr:alpha-ketoglutarate-dependent dioxygenase AlkB [Nocardioides sp. GY 10113]TIC88469.1 alpha-ketoglutarate-dependent dioxygenase AlkB [Nocardioides sp. GY 10113]